MTHFRTSLYCTSIMLPVETFALIEINSHFGGEGRVAYQNQMKQMYSYNCICLSCSSSQSDSKSYKLCSGNNSDLSLGPQSSFCPYGSSNSQVFVLFCFSQWILEGIHGMNCCRCLRLWVPYYYISQYKLVFSGKPYDQMEDWTRWALMLLLTLWYYDL